MAEIRTIAVISAGKLGRNIARSIALAGYRIVLEDVIPSTLRSAEIEIRGKLEAEMGLHRRADADAVKGDLRFADSLEQAAREADLAIEAVPDEMESKLEIFTLLDRICRPGAILASTTSALSITDIASVTFRRGKCIGMCFLDSVSDAKRVKVVRSAETDDETVAVVTGVAQRIGCDVSVVTDSAHSGQPTFSSTNA